MKSSKEIEITKQKVGDNVGEKLSKNQYMILQLLFGKYPNGEEPYFFDKLDCH
jgi:hypothetical protein